MASVATLAVKLIMDASTWEEKLNRTAKQAQAWSQTVGNYLSLSGLTGTIGAAVSIPAKVISTMISSVTGAIKGFLTSIPLIGDAFKQIPTSASEFLSWIGTAMDRLKDSARLADQLGISTRDLAGIQLAAGPAAEVLPAALFRMSRELADASAGSEEAAKKFARLGLDAQTLASVPLPRALGMISDQIMKLSTPTERMGAAFQVFGKQALALMPLLGKGTEGIAAATEKAGKLGIGVNRGDIQPIFEAARSVKEIKLSFQGLANTFAIGFAPLVAAVAEKFNEWVQSIGGAKPAIEMLTKSTVNFATTVLGAIADVIDSFGNMGEVIKHIIAITAVLTGPIVGMGKGGGAFRALSDQIRNRAASYTSGAGGPGIGTGDEDQTKLQDHIYKTVEALEKEIATFGMDEAQKKVWELANEGASESTLKLVRGMADQVTALKQMAEWQKTVQTMGAQTTKEVMSPYEKWQEAIADADTMLREHAITWEVYEQAIANATAQLEDHMKLSAQNKMASAAVSGSQEAVRIIQAQQATGSSNDPKAEAAALRKTVEQSLLEQRKQTQKLNDIASELRQSPVVRLAR